MELEEQEEASSKFKIIPVDICPVVTVGAVFKEMKNNEYVSVHCFINVEDRPKIPNALRFFLEAVFTTETM